MSNNNNNNNNNSINNSNSSSNTPKKDFAASLSAGAGELAITFLDRLKKSNASSDGNGSGAKADSNKRFPTSGLISNLAYNLHKNLTNNANNNSNTSGARNSFSFSKLLNENGSQITNNDTTSGESTTNLNKSLTGVKSDASNLVIYDDDNLDDAEFDADRLGANLEPTTKPAQVPTSKSECTISDMDAGQNVISTSASANDTTAGSTNSENEASSISSSGSNGGGSSGGSRKMGKKLTNSASLHKITNVLDEIKDTATSEAGTFYKRLIAKKKKLNQEGNGLLNRKRLSLSKSLNKSSFDSDDCESVVSTPVSGVESKFDLDTLSTNTYSTACTSTNVNEPSSQTAETEPTNNEKKTDETILSNDDRSRKADNSVKKSILFNKYLIGACIVVAVLAYLLLGRKWSMILFTYFFGFCTGAGISVSIVYLAFKFDLVKYFLPSNEAKVDQVETTTFNVDKLQSLLIQTAIKKENKNFDGVYKGWMNELREVYEPENYFLNKTRSVYLNLDGVMLRLQTTTSKIPKRAVIGENLGNINFNEQRIYDLTDCEVSILPKGLCRKRYWSKKYPICLKNVKLLSTKANAMNSANSELQLNSLQSDRLQSSSSNGRLNSSKNTTATTEAELDESTRSSRELDVNTLILFARTDREKEEWFSLFKKSSAKKLNDSAYYLKLKRTSKMNRDNSICNLKSQDALNSHISYSVTNNKIIYKVLDDDKSSSSSKLDKLKDKSNRPESSADGTSSKTDAESQQATSSGNVKDTQTDTGLLYDASLAFMNTYMIRIFADIFTHEHWIKAIQNKIQNKLSKIDVPYFMEELKVTGLDLGSVIPLIRQSSEPWYDERGLWVHLDIDYSGGLQMSLATKLNLMKLKSNSSNNQNNNINSPTGRETSSSAVFSFKNDASSDEVSLSFLKTTPDSNDAHDSSLSTTSDVTNSNDAFELKSSTSHGKKSSSKVHHHVRRKKNLAIYDSNEEDSPESSGDEYVHTGFNDEENILVETANASKKILNIVSKIAASNYFQKATENKYIKMAMENVSNCQLLLNVEVRKITGTLALNIPPHPSDRIWYGFASNPQLVLVATPQVGEKEVSYSAITDWIADKLKLEFQKVLVFPNMDDIYLPILKNEINNTTTTTTTTTT